MASSPHGPAAPIENGDTLPFSWYSDPAVFRAEKEKIFHRSWQYVGDAGRTAREGDFFTTVLGDKPCVVVRDEDGELWAFANVCRHRGSEVVLECSGNRKTLQCHYHGWTYGLDGTLRSAPRSREQASFVKEDFSLAPFQIASVGPLLFVNPDLSAPPFKRVSPDLAQVLEASGIELARMRLRRQDVYEIAANWKVIVENFNECYHCPIAHPAFSRLIDVDAYTVNTEREYLSTYYGPIAESRGAGVTYATLWPNAMFAASANPPSLQVILSRPVDPEHTRETIDYYFSDDVSETQIEEYLAFSRRVTDEDIVLCESVQRGMRSGVLQRGMLMLSREAGIQHFQRLVRRFVDSEERNFPQ